MAASSYYQEPAMAQAKPQFQPENTHLEGHGSSAQGLGQEMNSETRGYPQQAHNEASSGMYNGQQQPNMDQQHMATNNYDQGAPHQMNEQNSGVYGGQQQHQTGNSNYAQGADQQHMNGGAGKAAVADDRDTVTKCNDNPPDYSRELRPSLHVQPIELLFLLTDRQYPWLLTSAVLTMSF